MGGKMQKIYTLNELIKASKDQLNIHTIRDHFRRGELNPCIFFEGNLVCIKEERNPDKNNPYDPVVHIETVSWTKVFKGYVSAPNFIDHLAPSQLDSAGIFYNVDIVLEQIPPTSPLPDLQPDEYLKAFPRKIDDDIQEKRWLREINDFPGNTFKADEIFFHASEVDKILLNLNSASKSSPKSINHSDKPFLTSILNKSCYSALEAACLMTGDNPQALELLKENNSENYQKHYPENAKALNLILRAIEMNFLESNNNLIGALLLKEFLVTRGYLIEGFNRINHEGKHVMYTSLMEIGNREPRPIPNIIDFSVIEDPLSEDNYRIFKFEKLQEERKDLINKLNAAEQECKALKKRLGSTQECSKIYEELSGLQLKNQFDKDKQGMMRVITKYLYSLEENEDLKPIDMAEKVYKEMLNYVDIEDLPQNLETIKRYISVEIPANNKKPGRPKSKT